MKHLIGQRVDGYQLVEQLHRSFPEAEQADRGQVYRAVGLAGNQPVAVKVLPHELAGPSELQRLRQSLAGVARLRCAGVPPILGSGLVEGRPYILLPFYAAGSLADRLDAGLHRSLDAADLLNQLAATLSCIHQNRLAHGDLKPSKLLFDMETGALHVVGLGELHSRPAGTSSGAYAAPELAAGVDPDPAADQYAFGVIALELLTEWPAAEAMSALRAHSVGRLDAERLGLSKQTALVLSKATAVDPRLRFADIAEANRALQISLGRLAPVVEPTAAPEPPPIRRRPRRLRFGVIAVVMLLLGLAGTIPALSAGLIRLPGAGADAPASAERAQPAAEGGIALPTAIPSGLPGEADPQSESIVDDGEPSPEQPAVEPSNGGSSPSTSPTPTDASFENVTPATETPAATATPLPTETPPPPTAPPPTDTPEPPVEPTINPNKCKDDPSHKNYCTPAP